MRTADNLWPPAFGADFKFVIFRTGKFNLPARDQEIFFNQKIIVIN
jgi:hypothetical protein